MIKSLLLGTALVLSYGLNLAKPISRSTEQTTIFSCDFENYDGSTAADSFVWNSCNLVCDASSKSMVNSDCNITGWSIKTGGNGSLSSNGLLCSRPGSLDAKTWELGNYTFECDVRTNNVSSLGIRVREEYTDAMVQQVVFDPSFYQDAASSSLFYSVSKEIGDYYHISFDFANYKDKVLWFDFFGEFADGYIVVDNISIKTSANDYSTIVNYKYKETFSTYDGVTPADAWLWNNIGWCCDADYKSMINSANDQDGIDGWSLKSGANNAGLYGENLVFCSRSNTFNTGKGIWTIEFDIKFHNVLEFEYRLKQVNLNGIIARLNVIPSNLNSVTGSSLYVYAEDKGNDVVHITLDATTEDSNNWSEFVVTYGEGGGYIVVDNITLKESNNDYSVDMPLFTDTYENYRGESDIPGWVWNNTHCYSDSTYTSIEEGFDGLALHSRTPDMGNYSRGGFLGLQGSNGPSPVLLTEDELYEFSFDFAGENIESVFAVFMYNDPVKHADITLIDLSINLVAKSFTCNYPADVTFASTYNHALVQFKSPFSDIIFGYFGYVCGNNGHFIFDNLRLTLLKNYTIPLIDSGFESSNLNPFTIETNPNKKEEILGKVTNDQNEVINGTYSAKCGFDASEITESSELWGALLKSNLSFEENHHYALQFRFKVISDPLSYFYVEMGGSQGGLYLRFTDDGVVETSDDISGEVIPEGDHFILQVDFNNKVSRDGFIVATYGGGFIVIDDFSLVQGSKYRTLPEIEKVPDHGTKVYSEGFENQTTGDYFSFKDFISGVDVFGARFGYNDEAINGAVSAVIYSGCEWGEEIVSVDGKLKDSQIYTLAFRYKPLSLTTGNISIIVRGDSEKYIAVTLDGKISGFTYSKGGFFKDINLASVEDKGDYYEAKITFISPAGNSKIVLGTYGVCEVAIDDLTLYEGGLASFDTEVNKITTPDRSELDSLISKANNVSKTKYTEETYNALLAKLNAAKAVKADITSTQEQVTNAVNELKEALENLLLISVDNFNKLVLSASQSENKENKYKILVEALEAYNEVEDKSLVSASYESLMTMISEYNAEVQELNDSLTYEIDPELAAILSNSIIVLGVLLIVLRKGLLAL